MHPAPGHPVPAPNQSAPSTLASQGGPSSPFLMESLGWGCRVEELDLPSPPDTFEACRDLIAMTVESPHRHHKEALCLLRESWQ